MGQRWKPVLNKIDVSSPFVTGWLFVLFCHRIYLILTPVGVPLAPSWSVRNLRVLTYYFSDALL